MQEDLVKHCIPARGEMTDAAMAARAECVMLNKGPRSAPLPNCWTACSSAWTPTQIFKKTPMLRPLKSW